MSHKITGEFILQDIWEKPVRKYAAKMRGTWYANYLINIQGYSIVFLQKQM